LPRFDIIVAVSENTKRDLVELFNIPAEKIKVIYPGAGNLAPARPIDLEETQKKYHLPADYFLYVGNLEPRKNVASIILAFDQFLAEHPEYNSYGLVLAGSKGWKFNDVFSAWKSALNKDKIQLLGYVSETEKNCLFARARILIYPSFYEGFGFPVLEAMAAGVPVITSTNSSLPEVAQDAAILINPFNLAEIKAAMLAILASSQLRELLRGKAKLVKDKFKWEQAAQQYLKLFIS